MNRKAIVLTVLIFGLTLAASPLTADGSGQVRVGYQLIDEEGNLGVNQETYNLYEGPGLSLENFRLATAGGLNFSANLQNIARNDRNLTASVYKSGLFGVAFNNNQYRRIYAFDGDNYTRRRYTGGSAYITPFKFLKLYGGFSATDKHGQNQTVLIPIYDTLETATDYTQTNYNLGARVITKQASANLEYRNSGFTDYINSEDRYGHTVRFTGFLPLPQINWLTVSGGYYFRQDTQEASDILQKTNQGWIAGRFSLPRRITFEYRLRVARTEHSAEPASTDNYVNTFSLGYKHKKTAGLKIGYENRITDDIYNRTTSDGFLFSGWLRYTDLILLRGQFSGRTRDISDGKTLTGQSDHIKHQLSLRLNRDWAALTIRYAGQIKSNDEIDTEAEYNSFSAEFQARKEGYGSLNFTYSYMVGEFDNRSGDEKQDFEFSDHMLTGGIHPEIYYNFETALELTYYRSYRDTDFEKIGFHIEAAYLLPQDYKLGLSYSAYNFDNFLVNDRYYTGNIVNLYLIKSFTL